MSFWTKLRDFTTGNVLLKALQPPDLGAAFDKQLQAQSEAAKLNAANEAANIAQFDAQTPNTSTGTDMRRKKKPTGGYAESLGLQV